MTGVGPKSSLHASSTSGELTTSSTASFPYGATNQADALPTFYVSASNQYGRTVEQQHVDDDGSDNESRSCWCLWFTFKYFSIISVLMPRENRALSVLKKKKHLIYRPNSLFFLPSPLQKRLERAAKLQAQAESNAESGEISGRSKLSDYRANLLMSTFLSYRNHVMLCAKIAFHFTERFMLSLWANWIYLFTTISRNSSKERKKSQYWVNCPGAKMLIKLWSILFYSNFSIIKWRHCDQTPVSI